MRRFWEWLKRLFRSFAFTSSVRKPKRTVTTEYVNVRISPADSEWLSRDFGRAMDGVNLSMDRVGRAMDRVGKALDAIGTPPEVKPTKKDDDFNIN